MKKILNKTNGTPGLDDFWSLDPSRVLGLLNSSKNGLASAEAADRLSRFGANTLVPAKRTDIPFLLVSQFKSPLILILLFATGLSFFLRDPVDAVIILIIVLFSGLLSFLQEHSAANAVKKLLSIVRIKAAVFRDGALGEIPVEGIVPGDVISLRAGDVIPGDCLLLDSLDLFVDEAVLTGETFPAEKSVSSVPAGASLARRTNSLWMGTHVISGSALAVVVLTGGTTEFGKISGKLALRPLETEFERGVRRFGYLLMEVTLVLVVVIFGINVFLARPILDSFLFSLALAVGLTPQLLPAIISINLSHGAKRMAQEKVIVKRLASIENFGSMNVICSDKTGTLTEGKVHIRGAMNADGKAGENILLYAYLNAFFETGFRNPLDQAIRDHKLFDIQGYKKLDEIPYDFIRKRLSIVVEKDGERIMIAKGALPDLLDICTKAVMGDGEETGIDDARERINRHFQEFSNDGYRTIGVASKKMDGTGQISKKDETGMTFLGFLLLFDPLKPGIRETIASLKDLGVSLKIITGDNRLVAGNISRQIGMLTGKIITGPELRQMSETALLNQLADTDIFADVDPDQKERIVRALRKAGNVVGYMGDGVNDAPALHASDVGISVEGAVDVAKEAADIVLLQKDLAVLVQGVREGRRTFANTLKYVFMATSANFGNMFSMAGASLFLSFLPLLPKQILLTNLMTDIPEMTIATDSTDPEMVARPRRWDIKSIRRFMITFGIVSSVFDFLTFGVLLIFLHASKVQFRTGWFIESVVSASLIVLIIRSRRPFYKSAPSRYLLAATLSIAAAAVILPFTPLARIVGFAPLPPGFLLPIGLIILLYAVATEIVKHFFYKKENG